MTPSPRAATAGPASLIVREQKDLILSAMLCLGGICLVLQSWTPGLFVCCRAFVFKGEPAMFSR